MRMIERSGQMLVKWPTLDRGVVPLASRIPGLNQAGSREVDECGTDNAIMRMLWWTRWSVLN